MKTKKILILLFNALFLLSCVSTPVKPERNKVVLSPVADPPTLHAVILADIHDNKIGTSTQIDFNNIKNLVTDISRNTGMILAGYEVTGRSLTNNNVRKILNNLAVKRNDAVIFYYAGHGKNLETGTIWPSMILDDKKLELNFVVTKLQQKNPRFFLAIADACNDFPNSRNYPITNKSSIFSPSKTKNYKNLFLKARGYIVASGAKPGQLSWSDSNSGGLFTNQFLESLNRDLLSSHQANWNRIMESAVATIQISKNVIQQPQYKIDLRQF